MKTAILGDICNIIAGQSPPSSTYNKDAKGLPFFQGKADFGYLYPGEVRTWCSTPLKIAEQGDILISVRAPVGPTNICSQRACIGRGLSAIRAGKNVDVKYLLYFLRKHEPKLARQGKGSTFSAIKQEDIRKIKIPLPRLEDQQHIVELLDGADALRQKRKQAITLLNNYLKSVFLEMFGDPVKNPKGWAIEDLGNLTNKITDGTHKTPVYTTTGIKFISAKNIKEERITWEDIKHISEVEHHDIYKRCNPERNDLLLTKSGSLGMAALVDVDFQFSLFESLALLKVKAELAEPIYLREYLNLKEISSFYSQRTKGVGVKHLHLIDIKSLPIMVPPKREQQKFVQKVHKIKSIKQKMLSQSEEMENQFQALMQKAFKGEL